MRGDDQSSRYPPRGVWFGLMLLIGMGQVLFARDEPDASAARRLQDPIVLAGRRVTEWSTADARWVHLFGQAAVLQGVEGLRAREAVVRIVERSSSGDRTVRLEVYAEGDVGMVGASGTLPSRHAVFQTAREVRLSPYASVGFYRPEGASSSFAAPAPFRLPGASQTRGVARANRVGAAR